MEAKERFEAAVSAAEDMFWEEIAARYPEAETGGTDPIVATFFRETCRTVVRAWLHWNLSEIERQLYYDGR